MSTIVSIAGVSGQIGNGRIGVIPTDTIYGLVCSALNPEAVERVYRVRNRKENKPCIVLISDVADLKRFNIKITEKLARTLDTIWPGEVSVVLDCPDKRFTYLHRGTKTLAFRVPADQTLLDILKKTGPLVAPSANRGGEPHAQTVNEARTYFGDEVDFYLDGGKLIGRPSTLVKYEDGKLIVLREGAVRV